MPIADVRAEMQRERALAAAEGRSSSIDWALWERMRQILACERGDPEDDEPAPPRYVWVRVPVQWRGLSMRHHKIRTEGSCVYFDDLGYTVIGFQEFLRLVGEGRITDLWGDEPEARAP